MSRKLICAILIVGAFNFSLCAPRSNLDLLYSLIESSIAKISEEIPGNIHKFRFKYNSPGDFSSLENRVVNYLQQRDLLDNDTTDSNSYTLNYTVENIEVDYSNTFKDGLFGDYKVERSVSASISYNLSSNDEILASNIFNETVKDSINYSKIESVEARGLDFTQAEKPAEPFFSSLLEPVIALGVLIVSIILLFSVRSK